MMRKIVHIALFWVCLFGHHQLFAKTILIDSTFKKVEIYNALKQTQQQESQFIQDSFSLKNNSSESKVVYLSIIHPTADSISLKIGNINILLGNKIQAKKLKYKYYNRVYVVTLLPNETKNIQVKIQKKWQYENCRIVLNDKNTFIKNSNHDNFFLGIFFGILFMYFLLLICFYIFSKSSFFIIYSAINFFLLLLILQYSGIGKVYFWSSNTLIQEHITAFAILSYFSAHILFIRTFFDIQFKNDYSQVILKSLLYAFLFFILIYVIQIVNNSITFEHTILFYFIVNGLLIFYVGIVVLLCYLSYKSTHRREVVWVLSIAVFHLLNWLLFINNEFAFIKFLNPINNFRFFTSNLYISEINFYFSMLEYFVITVFIAINYHQLIKQNNLSSQRLEFLQKKNINTFIIGQEEERDKLSEEINLTINKDIQELKAHLKAFKPSNDEKNIMAAVLKDIDKTMLDINNITHNYVAPDLQQMPLIKIISTATERISAELNLHYQFSNVENNFTLSPVANINIYRILQEISNNILKHAQAKNVDIIVQRDVDILQIIIKDDGIGITSTNDNNKGIGLMNIESRVNGLNGHFYVQSNNKKGISFHLIFRLNYII